MASSSAGRSRPSLDRPYMSDLRIVLLGKNVSENSRVGNIILGTAAFHSEASSSYLQQHSQRISGTVEKRHITVINTAPLLQPHLTQHQLTQRVRECVSLSAPGPHVILLVLQNNDFSEEDLRRVKTVLNLFSVKAIKHTIVLTTDEETLTSIITSTLLNTTIGSSIKWVPMTNNIITNLTKECGGGHLKFDARNPEWRSQMIRKTEEMLKLEHEEFLVCNMYEDGGTSADEDPSRSGGSFRGDGKKEEGKLKQNSKTASDGGVTTSGKAKLNIVLCGYNTTLKISVSKILRGKPSKPHKEMSKVCEKKEEKIHGWQITVIELPALTRLSEEEVMRETLRCVYLCHPGVHAFVLVTPVGPLTNDDKAEMEKIKRIFFSNEHFMVLFTTELTVDKSVSDFVASTESQSIVSLYGSWYSAMGLKDDRNSAQISKMLDCIDSLKTEPYSLQMYMRAPEERVRHELEEKLRVRDKEIKELQEKIKTLVPEGVKLNLVLCGSNRRLKSLTSDLLLNQGDRRPELSSECVRRDVQLHGRLVSLVELPALFNTQISEEEVMRLTLRCVSLCDPGVHVFILTILDGPLNNEDRAEMENIQKIFSSRINKHIMIFIVQNSEHQTAELHEETQSVIERFGRRHHFIGPKTQVSVLMEKLEQMVEANHGVCFSSETLLDAQIEKLQTFEEMKRKIHSLETWFQSKDSRERADDLRIVLLGKTGAGKSSTGNTILGREAFISESSHESVTKECLSKRAEINGRHVTVIDTPGLFDTDLTNEEIQREISNCISMILPGPHVLLLLIPVGRFTQEEEKAVKIIQETFGEKSLMFTIVLFTRGDDLKNKTIEQWLGKPGSVIRNLIEECGNRYHVFNNNQTGDRTQVSDLLKKIDDMVKENGDNYYSCKMFREMERGIQEQQMKILTEKVQQLNREKVELMNKHEEDKKRMKMMMEEERDNCYKERKTREEEFRKREEQYKRDIKEREDEEREMREEMKREREEWEKQKQQERQRREEEDERRRKKEKTMMDEHNQEKERMKTMIEEERQNHDKERKRREEEDERRRKIDKETWDEYYEKLKREREKRQAEREDLQFKHEEEKERMKMKMDKERQNHDKERKRREEEYIEREGQYRRDIKDIEDLEREMREEMKREREKWNKQKQQERQRREETHNTDTHPQDAEDLPVDPGGLRILLFGRTGTGKSATGNTILGKKEFESKDNKGLVTTLCQKGNVEVDGKSVAVVDTPGLLDLSLTKEQVQEEMMRCVSLSGPGPHVFIIVLSLGRITQEEKDTLDMIKMIFGPKAADFSIVLFTKGDALKDQTIEQYVEKSKNAELKKLIRECGNRFLAFNNTETQDRTQVTELLNMIEEVKISKEGRYFTNEMFQEAATSVENRRKILEENKRQKQAQVKELEARYELEIKRMRQSLEEKKLKTDERERLENKFRGKEETLMGEFEEKEKSEQKKREMEDQKRSEEEEQRRAEYDQKIVEMEREIKKQRLLYEKQLKEREEECKQGQENMKTEQERIMAELRRKQEEEIKKRDLEEQMRKEQEEKEREEWKRKIKETEDEEIQEGIKRQQREWEEEKKRQMTEREDEEIQIKERHEEQLREKQGELEKMRKTFEAEREEKQMIEDREKQRREREEKEYEEERNEMKRRYDQLERERKEEWNRRKQEDEERREEKRKRWKKMMKDLKQEQEEEIKRREREERDSREREEKECDEMKQKHKEEIKEMKKKHEDEARKQEEELNDFRKRKDEQVLELKERLEQLYKEKHRWCVVM